MKDQKANKNEVDNGRLQVFLGSGCIRHCFFWVFKGHMTRWKESYDTRMDARMQKLLQIRKLS